jgi:rubredoxin
VWLLFHHNAKTKVVENGRTFVEICPECGNRARFHEVEITENVGVFFIDILGDKERKFRCGACANVFDRADAPAQAPAKSAKDLERERATEQARRRAAEQRRREAAEAKANRIEDELAELKKRLGR